MKRLVQALALCGVLFFMDSCKDDPAPIAGISFEKADEEINESDGTTKSFNPLVLSGGTGRDLQVKVLLDKPAPDNIVISYTVAGTASRTIAGRAVNDFNLNGANAKATETLIIEKGASEAIITLNIFEDDSFEIDDDDNLYETVILTLDKVVSGSASLSETNKSYTLKINEDDLAIILQWDSSPETTTVDPGNVDLDIFVWLNSDIVGYSVTKSNEFEAVIIPAGYPDGNYGISYPYYEGSSNNVKFGVYMFGRSVNNRAYLYLKDNPLAFSGTYTQTNVNKYDLNAEAPAVHIAQTIAKTKLNFAPSAQLTLSGTTSRTSGISDFTLQSIPNTKLQLKSLSK
jgi:hypothetical protein